MRAPLFYGPPAPPELTMTRGARWALIRQREFWLQWRLPL